MHTRVGACISVCRDAGVLEEDLSAFSPLRHGLLLNPKLGWRPANKSQRLPCLPLLPQHRGYRHNHAQLFVCLLEIQAQVLGLEQQGLLPTDLSPRSLTFDFVALEIPKTERDSHFTSNFNKEQKLVFYSEMHHLQSPGRKQEN